MKRAYIGNHCACSWIKNIETARVASTCGPVEDSRFRRWRRKQGHRQQSDKKSKKFDRFLSSHWSRWAEDIALFASYIYRGCRITDKKRPMCAGFPATGPWN